MNLKPSDKHLLYTELAKLVEAGFGIREAAAAILASSPPAKHTQLLTRMSERLEAGESIARAFGEGSKAITPMELSILGAGERSGRLGDSFQHLADYFGMLATARRDSLHAMIYPLVLLHLGLLVAVIPVGVLTGTISLDALAGRLLITLLAVYAAVVLLVLGIVELLKAAPTNAPLDRIVNRMPWLGKARRSLAMARFTKVYHTCLLAGLTMSETAATATQAAQSGTILEAGRKLEQTAKEGNALGPVFVANPAFPNAFSRSYATAETSGSLDKDLSRWSTVFQGDAERATRALSAAIPKVLYALIVIFIVWKMIGFEQGYANFLQSIGDE